MDVVYVCRHGENNEELRHSLRSLSNLPHGEVWIFGGAPSWVDRTKVNVVEVPLLHEITFKDGWLTKYLNVRNNLVQACNQIGVSEYFVLMNDDFYVTAPINEVPLLNYGDIEKFNSFFKKRQSVPTRYVIGEQDTIAWLTERGVTNPVSFSLHVPMVIEKGFMRDMLNWAPLQTEPNKQPLHVRTAYGNLFYAEGQRGTTTHDVKVERGTQGGVRRLNGKRVGPTPTVAVQRLPEPFASSSDRSFKAFQVGAWVRNRFQEKCEYEK